MKRRSENFDKFTGKYLCNKALGLRPATLLTKRLWHVFSCKFYCEISKDTFFHRSPLVAASLYNGNMGR